METTTQKREVRTKSNGPLSEADHRKLVNSLFGKYKGRIGNSEEILEEHRKEIAQEASRYRGTKSLSKNGSSK